MLPVLDMRLNYPSDEYGTYLDPDKCHVIDDETGDFLRVAYTDAGWMASRHIADPIGDESDELYWALTGDSPFLMLLRCGAARLSKFDRAVLDLCDLVEDVVSPIAYAQVWPIHSTLKVGTQPVEAEYRPASRDRFSYLTDGQWQDVNGASGLSMRPTGGTFVVQVRRERGYVTHLRVTVNPSYNVAALEKCLHELGS